MVGARQTLRTHAEESAEFGNQAVALFVYRPDTGEIEFPIMHT
jgi:hypothetical protein